MLAIRTYIDRCFVALMVTGITAPAWAGEWVTLPMQPASEPTRTTTTTTRTMPSTQRTTPLPYSSTQVSTPASTAPSPSSASTSTSTSTSVAPASTSVTLPALTQTQTTTTTVKADPHLKPFLAAVRANFPAWDRNHDGTLDRQEMEIAAQDFHYTDDAAVALAVLKNSADIVFRKNSALTLIKLADLDDIETKVGNGEKIDPDYGRSFASMSAKLKSEPKQLFTGALPHLVGIHQASTLDCYFLSSVGGLVETNPRAIVDMIRPNPDGYYTVTFPGKAPMIIPPPTETEMAAYTDAADGFWLNILEKGYGRIRGIAPKDQTAEPLDNAALFRGSCSEVVALLTGHKVKTIRFHSTAPNAPTDEAMQESVRAALRDNFARHEIVTTAKSHHAYTVTEFDTTKDTVTVHNPYGQNGHERWLDGSLGPRMEHGYFTCSIPDFVKNFREINCEM